MSAKIHDGLSYIKVDSSLLKRPLPIGGWHLNLGDFGSALLSGGWGWEKCYEEEYRGAVLIAPLILLYWGTFDD